MENKKIKSEIKVFFTAFIIFITYCIIANNKTFFYDS